MMCLAHAPLQAQLAAPKPARLATLGADGKLFYTPYSTAGDILPDFSRVGYMAGNKSIPLVPVKVTLLPGNGVNDDTLRIQAALDKVGALTPDANGFRGAVLLKKGVYLVANTVTLKASGVVLRGEGKDENGTVIKATAAKQYSPIALGVATADSRNVISPLGSNRDLVFTYVPVGARTLTIAGSNSFKAGDRIMLVHHHKQAWIDILEMGATGRLGKTFITPWTAPYTRRYEREIVSVSGNTVTLNIPIVEALDSRYSSALIHRYAFDRRIQQVGVENFRVESYFNPLLTSSEQVSAQGWRYPNDYVKYVDENHAHRAVSIVNVEHGWARDINARFFSYATVDVGGLSKNITVEDCGYYDGISRITGGQRYSFNVSGQQVLVQRCYASTGRHSFVLGAGVCGPTVFLDCIAEKSYAISEPHQRWSTGVLYDNVIEVHSIGFQNRGSSGTGHGWTMTGGILWNCSAPLMITTKPQVGENFAIGMRPLPVVSSAQVSSIIGSTGWSFRNLVNYSNWQTDNRGSMYGTGYRESWDGPVIPASLYAQQLKDRLAPANTPPVISTIASLTVASNTSSGALAFTVGDAETSAGLLLVTASSTNQLLVANSMITLGGSGPSRSVQVTPSANQGGSATITLKVTDGQATSTSSFLLAVKEPVNNPPTISAIPNQSIAMDSTTEPLAFTIGDLETPAADLQLSVVSSNTSLVAPGQVAIAGAGANRTLKVSPARNTVGSSILTVQVNDGAKYATASFVLTVTGLPVIDPPVGTWTSLSIGDAKPDGSAVLAAGTFTLKASGSDIWVANDGFHFAHQSLTGDGELIARVGFLDNPGGNPWAKLGVMMRESLAPNSRNVMTLLSFSNGGGFQYRASTGGSTVFKPSGNSHPWVRLVRAGDTFTGYSSVDGINWIELGSTTLEMPATLYVGLAAASHRNGYVTTGKFENVSGFGIPASPLASQSIGVTTPVGSASLSSGTFTLKGSGADIWNGVDAFHFNHQVLQGDGELIARVGFIENPGEDLWAKLGLMMRESLAPSSRNVMVHLSAGNGNRLQYRAANGGSSVSTGSGSRPWIRLVRAGNTFSGFSSDDGVSWIQLGVTTMSMPENLYVGLAVTSHRDGYLTTGAFNNVSGLGSLNNPHAAPATTPAATASPLLAFAAVPSPLPVQYPSISAMSEPYPSGYLFDGEDAGVLDLLAEAFGGNPLVARAGGGFQTIIDDRLTLTFVRSSPYLVYEVLATDAADDWTVLETNPGKVGSEVTVYDTVPASLNPTRTLRLHITTP